VSAKNRLPRSFLARRIKLAQPALNKSKIMSLHNWSPWASLVPQLDTVTEPTEKLKHCLGGDMGQALATRVFAPEDKPQTENFIFLPDGIPAVRKRQSKAIKIQSKDFTKF